MTDEAPDIEEVEEVEDTEEAPPLTRLPEPDPIPAPVPDRPVVSELQPPQNPMDEVPDVEPAVQDVPHGFYWVQEGDTVRIAVQRVYGTGELSKLTPTIPRAPGFTMAGHWIRTPDVPGKVTRVHNGETAEQLVKRMGFTKSKKHLARFHAFNGGEMRPLKDGTLVFMPDDES